MLHKFNSLWKNLLLDILGLIILTAIIIFNILNNLHTPNFTLIFGFMGFLFLHGLFLLALFIRNIIDKKYLKAFGFILISVLLNIALWSCYWIVFVFLIGVDSPDAHMNL
ncbi:MAG: hypothetical protein K0Q95_1984 [Bacteroidota bacterium]|jgi:hypothetical protein|nr:hypothetical protein [Bacteroidota bacterium]